MPKWRVVIGCWLAAVSVSVAVAQSYPARPIRLVVPNAPGSSGDIVARVIAPALAQRLGQPVVVENRAGAGTTIGTDFVVKAPPDGYTVLLGFATLAINPALYRNLPYDATRDLAPITHAVSVPGMLGVHPSLPVRTVKDLIALARSKPKQIAFSSSGQGTFSHVATELFASLAGIHLLHVPYKGTGPAATALISGETSVQTSNLLTMLPHANGGRIRALGVTSEKRSPAAPALPTIAESGVPGYRAEQWLGFLAPARTPREIITRLHDDILAVLRLPDTKERLAKDGADVVGSTPQEFVVLLQAETTKWRKVLEGAGIRPE